ncbi:MAG: response regulator [Bacteroidetes bacterium]|jgi:PAS domain S-box-containing protein|nr:response regulator [Bacteroidota bacterium]
MNSQFVKEKKFLETFLKLDNEQKDVVQIAQKCFNIVGVLIIALDLDGNIMMVNKKTVDWLGIKEEELIGKNWIEQFVHDSDKRKVKNYINQIIQEKNLENNNFRFQLVQTDNAVALMESTAILFKDSDNNISGVIISCEDVSDYLATQSQLKDSINLYRVLAGNIPDTNMYLFDRDTRHIIAEGREMKRHGLSKEVIEGKKLDEIMDNEMREFFKPLYQAALDGKEISTEYEYHGSYYLIWVLPVRNQQDEIYAGMAITQNITEDKLFEDKIRSAKDEAEAANRAKSEFLATITHEIRTPLNAIIGFTEQVQKTELDEKQENFMKIIEKSSEHLLSLVNEILVLSRIEAGEVRFDEVPFKIEHVVTEVYDTLKIKADQKNIQFHYQVHDNVKDIFIGDPFRLKQILINILNNAIKFTEAGYVSVNCFAAEDKEDKSQVRFDVTDTGVGISQEKIDSIFDQFKQADSTVTRKYGGTGLGLTISKKLTELQNGKISVRSQVGMGTQFTILLPYKKAEDDVEVVDESGNINRELLHGLSFLLVDDDTVNRLLGKTILDELECDTDVAGDGKEAIEKIKNKKYDAILLDIHMPQTSGLDVADFIRKELKDNNTKIIAVTAAVLKADIENYQKHGIDDYLIKPFREINLYHKIIKNLNLGDPKIILTEAENILHDEKNHKSYDLSELKQVAKSDNQFYINMLNTFINNTKEGLQKLDDHLATKKWEDLGEAAHKMLPSFRHIKVNYVIDKLFTIKIKTLEEKNYEGLTELVEEVKKESNELITDLEQEIEKARQA